MSNIFDRLCAFVLQHSVRWNRVFLNKDDDAILIFVGNSELADALSWEFMQEDYQVFVVYTTADYTPVRSASGFAEITNAADATQVQTALDAAFALLPNITAVIDARDSVRLPGPPWLYDSASLGPAIQTELLAFRNIISLTYPYFSDTQRGLFVNIGSATMFLSPEQGALHSSMANATNAYLEALQYELGTPWKTDIKTFPVVIAPGPTQPIDVAQAATSSGTARGRSTKDGNQQFTAMWFLGSLGSHCFPYVKVDDIAKTTLRSLELGSAGYQIWPKYISVTPWIRAFNWHVEEMYRRVTGYDQGVEA